VLITIPCLRGPGGVANFYDVIRPVLDSRKEYFEVGKKPHEKTLLDLLFRYIGDLLRLNRKLRDEKYDIVHINPSLRTKAVIRDGFTLIVARLHHVPVLVFFRGWGEDLAVRIEKNMLFMALFRCIYGSAAGFIVLANEFGTRLSKWKIKSPIFQLSTVVADEIFQHHGYMKEEDKPEINVLFLSRIEREKGIYEAIDAINYLRSGNIKVMLNVAGNGGEMNNVKRYVAGNGITGVKFLGYVTGPEKAKVFVQADVYLFPTYGEGMPNSVLEAMAYGLPVITRPVGGLKDFFENGRMGFMTESLDYVQLAGLVKQLIDDNELRKRMGKYNVEYARENFSATRVAEKLNDIYSSVLNNCNHA
jgi:glycosyltransferase involved in cell wall biosynthesis